MHLYWKTKIAQPVYFDVGVVLLPMKYTSLFF
jgi:hypothetical protein